jgi:predicted 3-demethylubiquinone-9 3-methyltransferase (glyoxalase superfamily)
MFKRFRFLFLALILISYSLLYIATSIDRCDANCERISAVDTLLKKNRDYVYYTSRCNWSAASDSICVWVKDTSGIDWNLLADTVCQIATVNGLLQQKVFILKSTTTGFPDTVVKKQCP